ncbi:MAG TPA: single-stranded DNA-binding protein [Clostridia bacterium]|jgi:single-strand DNA-binding protein|nr:single-stranded DNA-binding protein [Clostridia bacterium]
MNKAILIGNLTKDPDSGQTGSGISYCRFTVAADRNYTSNDGTKATDFLPVVTWRGLADNCSKYLKKGSKVGVCGSIQTRSYDKDGETRYVTEIVADEVQFLSSRGDSSDADVASEDLPDIPEVANKKPKFGGTVLDGNVPF